MPFCLHLAMKNFAATCALLTVLVIATPGCYKTMDNRSKVGMPFKKDTIDGQYERNLDQVLTATRKALNYNGTPLSDDVHNHILVYKIDTRTVYVKLVELESNLTQV